MPANYEPFRTSVVSINFKTHEANDINDVIDNNKQLLRQCCISFKAVLRGFKTWNIYSSWDRRFRMNNWRSMPLDKRGNKDNTPRPMSWGWWWSDRTRGMAKHTYGVLIMMTRRDDVVRVKVGFNADNPHASPIFTVVQRRLEVTDFPLLKSLQTHSRWTPCSTPCTSPITSRWLSSTRRQIISAFLWEHRWLTCNSLRYL